MAGSKSKITPARIRNKLTKLGVYRAEFDAAIQRYVELSTEYAILYQRYAEGGYVCMEGTGTAAKKKSPMVATLENLRRDILALETSLGLTPQGLLKLKDDAFAKPKPIEKSWTEQLG